jgi:lactate dehydrogenase-like 2-hydroxyacid dehydrogenase
MKKVLITRHWPEQVTEAMQRSFEVTCRNAPLTAPEWQAAMQSYDAICPCVADHLSAEIYPATRLRTKILANYGVGYNHIDLTAAKTQGVTVTNTPGVLTDATADLAITLMLMLARRAGEGERQLRAGQWSGWYPTHMMGVMVTGATLGIIGMGRIGQAMARKAHYGFGMKILYHNRKPVEDPEVLALDAEYCENLAAMLARCDFVALHCPGGPATHHLMNAERLSQMPKHAFLINTARGDVVDEAALIDALNERVIAGAGLDVYEGEPSVPGALTQMENVVLLPHLGSATLQTRVAMGMQVLRNLDAFFSNKEVPDRVI